MKLTQLTIAGLLLAEGRGRTPPPTNDKCSDATEIEIQRQGNAVSMDGTLVGATMDVDVPICTYSNWDYRGVWYKITTSEYVGDISIDLCGLNDGKGDVSVYSTTKTDDDCSSITCVAGQDVYCEPSEEEKLVVPVDGTVYNYYIRVHPHVSAEETTFQLRIGPVSSPNDFNCIGEELTVKETLYRNMYIGPNWACPQGGYRFGLDNEGYLGAWDYDGAVWNSGFKGDHLRLQDDGNLVLRDEMEHAVWASNCYGPDVTLKKSNSRAVRAIAGNGTTVWGIYGNQETRCYPTGDAPEIKCRGTMLSPGERLYPNEYLCGVLGPVQRFGLNDNGKLDLWYGNRCMWSPDHHADGGHFLSMNDDGNLVLYKDRPEGRSAQWASSCYFANSVLKLSGEGVAVEKRNGEVLWRIENDGTESECYPQETEESDCSAVSFFRGNVCRITMVDLLNLRVVHIEAKDLGDGQFTVVDNYDGKSCPSDVAWEATIEVPSDKNEDFTFLDSNPARGVNCVELLEQYQMKDQDYGEHSMWLSFLPHEETPCTHFGRSLIYFMVNEWFYFG